MRFAEAITSIRDNKKPITNGKVVIRTFYAKESVFAIDAPEQDKCLIKMTVFNMDNFVIVQDESAFRNLMSFDQAIQTFGNSTDDWYNRNESTEEEQCTSLKEARYNVSEGALA